LAKLELKGLGERSLGKEYFREAIGDFGKIEKAGNVYITVSRFNCNTSTRSCLTNSKILGSETLLDIVAIEVIESNEKF